MQFEYVLVVYMGSCKNRMGVLLALMAQQNGGCGYSQI